MRTVVLNTINKGNSTHVDPLPGETPELAYFTNGLDGGHPAQLPQFGYMGADTRGISAVATTGLYFDKVFVNGVRSSWGWARGIDLFNDAIDTSAKDVLIRDVIAYLGTDAVEPYESGAIIFSKIGNAIGFARSNAVDLTLSKLNVIIECDTFESGGIAQEALCEAVYYYQHPAQDLCSVEKFIIHPRG